MKLKVTISSQHLMFLAVFVAALAVVGMAGAYNANFQGGNPSAMGHSSDEVMVNLSGTPTSLQGAMDSRALVKTGSYVGNGVTQEINVGFQPDSVMVLAHAGLFPSFKTKYMSGGEIKVADYYGGGYPFSLTSNGFSIATGNTYLNQNGFTYSYIAMKDG